MSETIERELRFVLASMDYNAFKATLRDRLGEFGQGVCSHETTVMFDNPNPELTFYSAMVDGRLRLRSARPTEADILTRPLRPTCSMLTWKQRMPEHSGSTIRSEREIEVPLGPDQVDAMEAILVDVLRCPRVSSYERRRELLTSDGVEVAVDLFPYGHVVELELKGGSESKLPRMAESLGLQEAWISKLSCDDMYRLLCSRAGRDAKADILFGDAEMPSVDEFLKGT